MWADRRVLDLVGIDLPILLAPMAGGAGTVALAVAVAQAGGLGSLPCAMLTPDQVRADVAAFRRQAARPIHLNFFAHEPPRPDDEREQRWRARLKPYHEELDVNPAATPPAAQRRPFDDAACAVVEELRPEVVSFHFGLPASVLVDRVKAVGCRVLATATTAREAVWLAARGCDAVIAQGAEAGGHRGMFLTDEVTTQPGSFALIPQVADAVRIPVVAAGGIADSRGVAAALTLGAAAVQIGTAYLFCPEARLSDPYRTALRRARDDDTAVTNVITGRPARGILTRLMRELGPISTEVPPFPLAAGALTGLRAAAEARGSGDFSPLWAGQAAALGREMGAGDLTRTVAEEASRLLRRV